MLKLALTCCMHLVYLINIRHEFLYKQITTKLTLTNPLQHKRSMPAVLFTEDCLFNWTA